MTTIEALRETIPDAAKDLRVNLGTVLQAETLSPAQRWGVAVASAIAARNVALRDAMLADAVANGATPDVIDDARASAALMGMNNVLYRFRHLSGKESYQQRPARLRMQRIAQPKSSKIDFELMSLAVSAINGCESCIRAHEKACIDGGLSEDQVWDAIRIASAIKGVAIALELGS